MSTTIVWKIANLERETADGFVLRAHYTVSAVNGIYSSGAYGSVDFERPNKLIPYADLTEKIVIEWLKDQLGTKKVTEIQTALQDQLNEQCNPTKAAGVPWQ